MSTVFDAVARTLPPPDKRLPPWTDQRLTPRSAIAWLTYDPVTQANMGLPMADHVIATLHACGFEIVPAERMAHRTAREVADEVVERIQYRIQAHHPRERELIRDLIESTIEEDRTAGEKDQSR